MIRFMKLDGGVVHATGGSEAAGWRSTCGNVLFGWINNRYRGRVLRPGSPYQPASFVRGPGERICRDCQRVMARDAATFAERVAAGEVTA